MCGGWADEFVHSLGAERVIIVEPTSVLCDASTAAPFHYNART